MAPTKRETAKSNKTKEKRLHKARGVKKRHVPHALQPVHKVHHRNARERTRIHAVNDEFARLRSLLPYEKKTRVPKEDIIRLAVTYIQNLQDMIHSHDANGSQCNHHQDTDENHSYTHDGEEDIVKSRVSQWVQQHATSDVKVGIKHYYT